MLDEKSGPKRKSRFNYRFPSIFCCRTTSEAYHPLPSGDESKSQATEFEKIPHSRTAANVTRSLQAKLHRLTTVEPESATAEPRQWWYNYHRWLELHPRRLAATTSGESTDNSKFPEEAVDDAPLSQHDICSLKRQSRVRRRKINKTIPSPPLTE